MAVAVRKNNYGLAWAKKVETGFQGRGMGHPVPVSAPVGMYRG